MAAGTHQRFHYAWETDLIGSVLKTPRRSWHRNTWRCADQFLGGKVADGTAVHGVVYGTGRRYNLDALLLEVEESLGADSFNLQAR